LHCADGLLIERGGALIAGFDDLAGSAAGDRDRLLHLLLSVGRQHLTQRPGFARRLADDVYVEFAQPGLHFGQQVAQFGIDGADCLDIVGGDATADIIDADACQRGLCIELVCEDLRIGDGLFERGYAVLGAE
jgi:hypothetical protein